MAKTEQPHVVAKGSIIYLWVDNRWYAYDERQEPLGAGAMGTVYLGWDCLTNEQVAVKRVMDRYANVQSIRERAKMEASMMFRHPNLIEMVGYCEVHPNQGPIFIISHLVRGMNIDKFIHSYIRKMPDAAQRICNMLFPVFSALEYLHSNGIVHMDIKPSNIMVENSRNVRLMDMGIACESDVMNITAAGLLGTPKYAAPEQFILSPEHQSDISNRTDIYELGVTIYELLAEFNPFEARNIEESKQKHHSIVLPYIQGVSKDIVDVLRKATAVSPADRYLSIKDFRVDLQAALLKKPKPNLKWIWIAIVAVMLLLVLILFTL